MNLIWLFLQCAHSQNTRQSGSGCSNQQVSKQGLALGRGVCGGSQAMASSGAGVVGANCAFHAVNALVKCL